MTGEDRERSYTVRENPRSKSVRLRMTFAEGLLAVVPPGFDLAEIEGIVRSQRRWVDRARADMERRRAIRGGPNERPTILRLRAIDEIRHVDWDSQGGEPVCIHEKGEELTIRGAVEGPTAWRPALRRWLVKRARDRLPPLLSEAAQDVEVRIERTTIRCQRSRWGSYTGRPGEPGRVSLNAKLLFLPKPLAQYVWVHELCHAFVPRHSEEFWNRVRTHIPDVAERRRQLREAWRYVPGWIEG